MVCRPHAPLVSTVISALLPSRFMLTVLLRSGQVDSITAASALSLSRRCVQLSARGLSFAACEWLRIRLSVHSVMVGGVLPRGPPSRNSTWYWPFWPCMPRNIFGTGMSWAKAAAEKISSSAEVSVFMPAMIPLALFAPRASARSECLAALRRLRGNVPAAVHDGLHGGGEPRDGGGLGDVAARACFEAGFDALLVLVGRHHQHGHRRESAAEAEERVDPGAGRQGKVEQHEVERVAGRDLQRLGQVHRGVHPGAGKSLPYAGGVDLRSQRLIVDEQDFHTAILDSSETAAAAECRTDSFLLLPVLFLSCF